jgi:GT2 family glycosyltransferase
VSIVIVSYHGAERFIARCLESLRALDYSDFEVIVVDNASNDATREAVRAAVREAPWSGVHGEPPAPFDSSATFQPRERGETVIWNSRNRGFAGGCNDGIARARGEVVVLLNYDTVVQTDWLRELVRPMTRDRRIAITGCKMFFPGSCVIQHAGGLVHPNGMTQHLGYLEEDRGQHDAERDVAYVTGAGLAVRRALFERCGGGLDEDFYPAYCEELDLCRKARRMGYRVVVAPRSVLEHYESPVRTDASPKFLRMITRARMVYCLKNFTPCEWLFGFLPFETRWMLGPGSRGHRLLQLRGYWDGLVYLLGLRPRGDRLQG